jgi:hypothetical protein
MVGFIIKRNNEKVNRLMEAWWAEICRWSYRDQVSFPVVSLTNEIKIKEYDLSKLGYKLHSHGGKVFPKVTP